MNKISEKAIGQIESLAAEHDFSFHISKDSEKSHLRLRRAHTTVHLGIKKGRLIFLYLYLRACEDGGRRTDLNESESILLATFLRVSLLEASCSLWDEPHPAIYMPEEIYARILTFNQFYKPIYVLDENGIEQINKLLSHIAYFGFLLPNYLDWVPDGSGKCGGNFSYDGADQWAAEVSKVVVRPFERRETYSNARTNPTWKYYRNIYKGISIFHASGLSNLVKQAANNIAKWEIVDGTNGKMFISNETKNIISFKNIRLVNNVLSKLNGNPDDELSLVPLENFCVASKGEYILFLNRDCGRKRFEQEKERIRQRHNKEAKILFPPTSFAWNNSIDDEEFELMILDLINRERGVEWARKASVSRERDEGKDLIAEWSTPPLTGQIINEGENPFTVRRVIIQCKASKSSVGKSKVQDIRDTVEYHNAQGYFLAVSSHLATSLTDHLLKLKDEGKFWIDWWTRVEIEERLKGLPEIVSKYPNVVRAKH